MLITTMAIYGVIFQTRQNNARGDMMEEILYCLCCGEKLECGYCLTKGCDNNLGHEE